MVPSPKYPTRFNLASLAIYLNADAECGITLIVDSKCFPQSGVQEVHDGNTYLYLTQISIHMIK